MQCWGWKKGWVKKQYQRNLKIETEAIDRAVWQEFLTILPAENGQIRRHFMASAFLIGGEAGGEAEMGFQTPRKAEKRHRSRVQRGLCPLNHRQETRHVCPI